VEIDGGDAAAVRFCGMCGARVGDDGAEARRLPRDCVDGVGFAGGVYCVPASTVVLEERLEDDMEGRDGVSGGDWRGNAAGGGGLMNERGDVA